MARNGVSPARRFRLRQCGGLQAPGSVGIGPIPEGFGIEVELRVSLPGLPREQARSLVEQAHAVCPYSNATRGNIDVTLTVV